MARRGPEAKIQDAVIKYAREKYDALCKKNEVGKFFVGSGWPDYIVLARNGRVFFIEFKAPGASLTPLQEERKKAIEGCKRKVYKVDSIAYGKLIIDKGCG